MRKSPDQDVPDWKRQRNAKSARQLAERITRDRRRQTAELMERYEREAERVSDRYTPTYRP